MKNLPRDGPLNLCYLFNPIDFTGQPLKILAIIHLGLVLIKRSLRHTIRNEFLALHFLRHTIRYEFLALHFLRHTIRYEFLVLHFLGVVFFLNHVLNFVYKPQQSIQKTINDVPWGYRRSTVLLYLFLLSCHASWIHHGWIFLTAVLHKHSKYIIHSEETLKTRLFFSPLK